MAALLALYKSALTSMSKLFTKTPYRHVHTADDHDFLSLAFQNQRNKEIVKLDVGEDIGVHVRGELSRELVRVRASALYNQLSFGTHVYSSSCGLTRSRCHRMHQRA